jgi:drug/metabolite transporter (DMT)-like permease
MILIASRNLRKEFGSANGIPRVRSNWQPLLAVAAVVGAVAVLAQFYAYRYLLVAYVESVKRAGGLLSVLIGFAFFGEEGLVYRIPAALIILSGAFLVLT